MEKLDIMPKGQNADGSKKVRPANSGAKPKPEGEKKIVKGPYRLSPDVVEILNKQPDKTAYIEGAIREKHQRES